jgi:hypothetical protein
MMSNELGMMRREKKGNEEAREGGKGGIGNERENEKLGDEIQI